MIAFCQLLFWEKHLISLCYSWLLRFEDFFCHFFVSFDGLFFTLPLRLVGQEPHGRILKSSRFLHFSLPIDSKAKHIWPRGLKADVGMSAVSYFISRIKRNHGSWNIELCVTLRAMAVHVLQGVTAVHNNTEGAIFLTILNLQRERHRIIESLWTSGWTFIVLCWEYANLIGSIGKPSRNLRLITVYRRKAVSLRFVPECRGMDGKQNLLNEIPFEISMYHLYNSL